jgi:transcriptional repressor NF-X1
LHALAEDFGMDSESQDPEPHRHVCIFKTPRFVSAPSKTLAQCLRIAQAAANLNAAASSLRPTTTTLPSQQQQENRPFNALLLKEPRFALTIDELDLALATDLAAASRAAGGPALTFTTSFLPSEEIVIRASPNLSVAAIATTLTSPTPQAVESALSTLKPTVARTVARLGLARAVALCHADASLGIVRREGDAVAGASADKGGWSAVASRGSWRRGGNSSSRAQGQGQGQSGGEQRASSGFVALRRLEGRRKEKDVGEEQVEEDWLVAAEKLGDGEGVDGSEEIVDGEAVDEEIVDGRVDGYAVDNGEGGESREESGGEEAGPSGDGVAADVGGEG